jgi:lysozyme
MRTVNENGLRIIKSYESCRLTSYADIRGIPTIGWGHTGRTVTLGQTISQDQADQLLLEDLAIAEAEVQTLVTVPLSDNQFSALVSLVYNCGRAPLVGHLGLYLNQGNYSAAADQFLRWDMAAGQVVEGLYDRRVAERNLFLK